MSSFRKLTIIVPVYNEEESLARLKNELDKFLAKTPISSFILFVDDGSTDGSLVLLKKFVSQAPDDYGFLSLSVNQGLSTAMKAGIDHVQSPYLGYIDADLQTTPFDFFLFFDHMESYTMINGIRQNRNDSLVKRLSSRIANGYRRMMINDGIEDTGCPLKIIETGAARAIPFFKGMHRFIPALIQLQGGTVKQIPVQHFPRLEGEAKYHLFNRLVGPFMDTFAFMWMRKRYIKYQIRESSERL